MEPPAAFSGLRSASIAAWKPDAPISHGRGSVAVFNDRADALAGSQSGSKGPAQAKGLPHLSGRAL